MSDQPAQEAKLTVPQALRDAAGLYGAGEWDRAVQACRRLLDADPQDFDALTLLGVIAAHTNRAAEASDLLKRAVAVRPDDAAAHANYGNVLFGFGRLEEALDNYQRALEIRPDLAEAHYNRANVLRELRRHTESLAGYERALRFKPDYPEAHNNRGNALYDLGRFAEALDSYQRALEIRPDDPEICYNRGRALQSLNRLDEALASYDRVLSIRPDHYRACNNRGNALKDLGRFEEALDSYAGALRIKPAFAQAYFNLGNALRQLRRLDEALASYDRALSVKPDYAEGLWNRGQTLDELGRLEEARDSYARALTIAPELPWLFGNWLHTEMQLCEWGALGSGLAHLARKIADNKPATTAFPVVTLLDSPPLQRRAAEIWVRENRPTSTLLGPIARRSRSGRIRLGYYSADFHAHATAHLIAELIEGHDRGQFDVLGFSFGPNQQDEVRKRLVAAFDRFIDISMKSDRDVAQLSRELGIDIAVDLKGFTRNERAGIFCHRAAPLQVNYLGYPGTMGAPYIDYLIADATVIPPESRPHYTEKIVYLPHSYQVNDRKRAIVDRHYSREELGLPPASFVFCCFNNAYKITPAVFDIWMRLLAQVPRSVLWLLDHNAVAAANLRREAEVRGVNAQRLVFAPRLPVAEHLARHRAADLVLDTLPYNAHTTASDALWAGVPVLTQMGESFAARVAGSLLTAIGLPELITHTAEQYQALARELATKAARLAALRAKLQANRLTQPLFDTPLYTRHLEEAYRQMHARGQAGLSPEDIRVAN
jgi:predicted O-linked N-acetylglucosamine transferase (SPINDLY family)